MFRLSMPEQAKRFTRWSFNDEQANIMWCGWNAVETTGLARVRRKLDDGSMLFRKVPFTLKRFTWCTSEPLVADLSAHRDGTKTIASKQSLGGCYINT